MDGTEVWYEEILKKTGTAQNVWKKSLEVRIYNEIWLNLTKISGVKFNIFLLLF